MFPCRVFRYWKHSNSDFRTGNRPGAPAFVVQIGTGLFLAISYFQQDAPVRFPLSFFHSYVFSTTSPLCFSVCSALFLVVDPLFSATYPVLF
jgi:hypothetical protein